MRQFTDEASWEAVTVHIDEYHQMSSPVFKMHFRMTRPVFEVLYVTLFELVPIFCLSLATIFLSPFNFRVLQQRCITISEGLTN